jgi:hypothetical protein
MVNIDDPPHDSQTCSDLTTTLIHVLCRLIVAPRLILATSTKPAPLFSRFNIPPEPIPDAGRPTTNGTADKQHPDHVTIHDEIEVSHTHQRH